MLNLVRALWKMVVLFFLVGIGVIVSTTDTQVFLFFGLSLIGVILICIQGAMEDEEYLK